jgi:hypothetical protein
LLKWAESLPCLAHGHSNTWETVLPNSLGESLVLGTLPPAQAKVAVAVFQAQ